MFFGKELPIGGAPRLTPSRCPPGGNDEIFSLNPDLETMRTLRRRSASSRVRPGGRSASATSEGLPALLPGMLLDEVERCKDDGDST